LSSAIADRLAYFGEILPHDRVDVRMSASARGDVAHRGGNSYGFFHYVMPTSLLSPTMKRYAAGLRCVRVILTFFPMRLASMRPSTWAIVEFSSTMEFSISQCSSEHPLPIE